MTLRVCVLWSARVGYAAARPLGCNLLADRL